MKSHSETARLRTLARWYGIQTSYFDVQGRRVTTPEATLRALLQALGIPARHQRECEESLLAAAQRQSCRPVDHVLVAWDGLLDSVVISGISASEKPLPHLRIVLEDGNAAHVDMTRCHVDCLAGNVAEGVECRQVRVFTGLRLPIGYHQLVCTTHGVETCSLVIAAPQRCYSGEHGRARDWGLFAPLYALRSAKDSGAGSYTDLLSLAEYVAEQHGGLVGTLPLLPCYFESGIEPSPYLPVSRLLWSEFYIDPDHIPFADECHAAQTILDDPEFAAARAKLRQRGLVDYIEVQRLKRTVLAAVYRQLAHSDSVQSAVERFVSSHPHVTDYASFRAARDCLQASWRKWPQRAKAGDLSETGISNDERRFREFEQWLAHEQMAACVNTSAARGVGLYLDLPVGVHPDGFDTWRYRNSFVENVSSGAPPDSVFTTGQYWDSAPLHPAAIREHHYDYVRSYLSHHMAGARMLRVDHVMGLHRMFCIPDGYEPSAGAYLRYRPEEWYALLSLESHRHKTIIVGEDLGLVPGEVHRAMARHGLLRMFVLYYEMDGLAEGRAPSIPANCLASLNTHDMPPFAAMWQGLDIRQQQQVGILEPRRAPAVLRARKAAIQSLLKLLANVCPHVGQTEELDGVLGCILRWLGTSRARFVMVNIEDLWLETAQQNIPGVGDSHPSWRHRAAMTMEQVRQDIHVSDALQMRRNAMRTAQRRVGGE